MTHVSRGIMGEDRSPGISAARPSSLPTILFVSPVADMKGGAERVLLDLLDNPSIRPALAVPGPGELAEIARQRGIPVSVVDLGAVETVHRPPRPGDLLRAAAAARRCAAQLAAAVAETGAAALHTNGLKVHVIGAIAKLLHRVPVVAHVHDIPHTRLEKAIWRGVAAGVTRTVLVSRPCFPGASLPARVGVVPNGLRTLGDRRQPRLLSATPTIGFVGRFHPFKGLHLLLDWFEHASVGRPDLRLLIRGRADAEGAAYWQSLQGRVARLAEQGRCRLLGWAGPGEDPYAEIDVLAVPSQTPDPAPLVIGEAMLRGIPVIGYPAGGIPDLIGGPAFGALAADAAAFAAAVDRLTAPDAYRAASDAGAARAAACFGIERFWAAIDAQYALAGVASPAHGAAPQRP